MRSDGDDAPAAGRGAPLVEATGLGLTRDGNRVLHDVDFAIDRGEVVTLIGPNGAGKTTLLKLVLGLLKPSAGRIARGSGLTFGYLPQRFEIDQTLPLSVARFLALPGGARQADIGTALAEVGVAYAAERSLQALSGGEFQRVMLARCLLRRPDILVLDEPMQGVDVSGQIALFELVARLRRDHGFAVLMVSHDLHLVMSATDRVVCLNRHVCCSGRPEQVSESPDYRALFGARAAEALALYTHCHNHQHDLAGDPIAASEAPDAAREGAALPREAAR